MEETNKKIKRVDLEIHEGNYNRRVKYGNVDFDILIVSLKDKNVIRYFCISKDFLPETDSVHLKYNPSNKSVSWSPQNIIPHVVELTNNNCQ